MMNGVRFSIPAGGRLICTADCHGDFVLLKRLINRLNLRESDVLVVEGDFTNKGAGNLACTAYLMDLARTRPNTIVLAGNGEYANIRTFLSGDRTAILNYIKKWPTNNLYLDWAAQCGYPAVTAENFDRVHRDVAESFADMMAWVYDLPLYAYDENYLLVHAGMNEMPENGDADISVLSDGAFYREGENRTGRWVIVGHMPISNLEPGLMTPHLDSRRRVIAIDGGVNTQPFSQLNALICSGEGFSWLCEARGDLMKIEEDYLPEPLSDKPLIHSWPDVELEILSQGSSFSLCRTKQGREGMVKNENIKINQEGRMRMSGNARALLLPVRKGQVVQVIDDRTKDYWFVRDETGETGFIPASLPKTKGDFAQAFFRVHKL